MQAVAYPDTSVKLQAGGMIACWEDEALSFLLFRGPSPLANLPYGSQLSLHEEFSLEIRGFLESS